MAENNKETKICKYCQTEIPKKAKICPNCKKSQSPKWIKPIVILLIFIIVVSAIANGANGNKTTNNKTNDEKFTLLDGTKGYADEYGIAYYIEGTVKNNTDKEYSYVQVNFNVYDKDSNNIGSCLSNNNNFEAHGSWKFKAICSGDAKSVASFKLKEITGY